VSPAGKPSWDQFRRSLRAEWARVRRALRPAALAGDIRRRLAAAAAAFREAVRREPAPKRRRFLF
jgi:hypothetical protein